MILLMEKNFYEVHVTWYESGELDRESAVFRIEPPITLIEANARVDICKRIIGLLGITEGEINITHESSDGRATIGYAQFEGEDIERGKSSLQKAVSFALNGK